MDHGQNAGRVFNHLLGPLGLLSGLTPFNQDHAVEVGHQVLWIFTSEDVCLQVLCVIKTCHRSTWQEVLSD